MTKPNATSMACWGLQSLSICSLAGGLIFSTLGLFIQASELMSGAFPLIMAGAIGSVTVHTLRTVDQRIRQLEEQQRRDRE
jgi:hypothetical protein